MKYAGTMDFECIPLCDAINKLSGLRTTSSCSGHNKEKFNIWFVAKKLKDLPALLYWFDGCHCGFGGWQVLVKTDCAMSPVHFNIEGPISAYKEADKIAELIEKYINDNPRKKRR